LIPPKVKVMNNNKINFLLIGNIKRLNADRSAIGGQAILVRRIYNFWRFVLVKDFVLSVRSN